MDIVTAAKDFLDQPFKGPIDTGQLFLLVGMISVFAILWSRILAHLAHV